MGKPNNDSIQKEINLLNIFNGIALVIILIIGFPIIRSSSDNCLISALIGCIGFIVNIVLAYETRLSKDTRFYQLAVIWSFALPIAGIYLFVKYYWK